MKTLSEGDVDTLTSLWAEDRIHKSLYPFEQGEFMRGREAMRTYAEFRDGVSDFEVLKNLVLSTDSDGLIGGRVK